MMTKYIIVSPTNSTVYLKNTHVKRIFNSRGHLQYFLRYELVRMHICRKYLHWERRGLFRFLSSCHVCCIVSVHDCLDNATSYSYLPALAFIKHFWRMQWFIILLFYKDQLVNASLDERLEHKSHGLLFGDGPQSLCLVSSHSLKVLLNERFVPRIPVSI